MAGRGTRWWASRPSSRIRFWLTTTAAAVCPRSRACSACCLPSAGWPAHTARRARQRGPPPPPACIRSRLRALPLRPGSLHSRASVRGRRSKPPWPQACVCGRALQLAGCQGARAAGGWPCARRRPSPNSARHRNTSAFPPARPKHASRLTIVLRPGDFADVQASSTGPPPALPQGGRRQNYPPSEGAMLKELRRDVVLVRHMCRHRHGATGTGTREPVKAMHMPVRTHGRSAPVGAPRLLLLLRTPGVCCQVD